MKPVIINIHKLIENFSITSEVIESKEAIKQFVTEALITAMAEVNFSEFETKDRSIVSNSEPICAAEKTTDLKLECLRLATQKNNGDVLNQAKETFAWLIEKN